MHITICKIERQWEFAVWLRELKPELCDNLERWDGVGGEREVQEGGVICIPTADLCWYMAETKTIYKAIILQLNINFEKTEVQYIMSNLRILPSISFYFYLNKLKNYLGQVECFFHSRSFYSYKKMKRPISNF